MGRRRSGWSRTLREKKIVWTYPRVGKRDTYLLYHEEMESLVKNIKG